MKLDTKFVQVREVTFEGKEIELLGQLLKYCVHRMEYHKDSGLNKILGDDLKKLVLEWRNKIK